MPRSERFSRVAARPFDRNSFEASLSVTTRQVAKMERILDELFDSAYRPRLRRLSQNSEEVFGFAGKFHVTIRVITVAVTVWLGKTESKPQICQKKLELVPTFDTIVSSSPRTL
jgi:hypothetical protein